MKEDWQIKNLTKETVGTIGDEDQSRDQSIKDKLYLIRKLKGMGVKSYKDETLEVTFADEILFSPKDKMMQNDVKTDQNIEDFINKLDKNALIDKELFNM